MHLLAFARMCSLHSLDISTYEWHYERTHERYDGCAVPRQCHVSLARVIGNISR